MSDSKTHPTTTTTTDGGMFKRMQEAFDKLSGQTYRPASTCPTCGRCPTCGKGNYAPWTHPGYPRPLEVWC